MRQFYIRADASRALGTGHVMRTLAIADEMARRGFATTFFTLPARGDLRDLVASRGHRVVSLEQVDDPLPDGRALRGRRAHWLLVDHYGLDERWERGASQVATRIAALDDLADRTHAADFVIDPNLDATAAKHVRSARRGSALLLGPKYAPLRPEFAAARSLVRPVAARVTTIVVSMGGADPGNATALATRSALEAVPDANVHVIAGPSFTGRIDDGDPRVHLHRSPRDMTGLLLTADLVIGAAGTSALERACLGIPSLLLRVADNQAAVASALATNGIAHDAGWVTEVIDATLAKEIRALADDLHGRERMHTAGMRRVDGLGAVRIANLFDSVRLRRARWSDRLSLFEWANDPKTRSYSSSTAPIALEEHLEWLRRNLADPRVDLLIAQNGLGPVGVLRLAPGWSGELEVSINIAPQHRGGVGTLMLRSALMRWDRRFPGRVFVARIKPGNVASERAFARVGFRPVSEAGETVVYARPSATLPIVGGSATEEVFQ